MARIFQDGFELGKPELPGEVGLGAWQGSLWQIDASSIVLNDRHIGVVPFTTFRPYGSASMGGTYALEIRKGATSNTRLSLYRDLEVDLKEHFGRIEFLVSTAAINMTMNTWLTVLHFRDNTYDNVIAEVKIRRSGDFLDMALYVNDVEVKVETEVFMLNIYTRLEWHLLIDDTNGIFEVLRNGDSVVKFEGNTDPFETECICYLCLGTPVTSTMIYALYYDDIAVNDTIGSRNNSFPGRGFIYLVSPKDAGTHTDWVGIGEGVCLSSPGHVLEYIATEDSDDLEVYPAHRAFNMDSSNFWRIYGNPSADGWAGFKLKTPIDFNNVWIGGNTSANAPKTFQIEGSNDGVSWTVLSDVLTFNNDGTDQEYNFVNTTKYRYYRFYCVSGYHSTRLYLYDVRFYKKPFENWMRVASIPDLGNEAYIKSDVAGDKVTFDMVKLVDDLGLPSNSTIKSVQHLFRGKYEDGEVKIAPILRSEGTDYVGLEKKVLNQFYKYNQQIWDESPFTSDEWTPEEIDELEVGVQYKEVE